MHESSWIVSSKTEGPENKINVTLRPATGESYGGSFTLTLPRAEAAQYEPGNVVELTLAVQA